MVERSPEQAASVARVSCAGDPALCPLPETAPVALSSLPVNALAHVCEHCLDPRDAAMLRAMGMRPCARVRMIRTGEPCIIEVVGVNPATGSCGCRIGLSRDLADRVIVRLSALPA
ncbi:MAG: FeoA family protein [Phycisphaerae bacterium]